MKKIQINLRSFKRIVLALSVLGACNLYAQPQLKKWYFNGEGVDFTAAAAVFPITGVPAASAISAANGMYDASGNMLFYVRENNIYAANGSFIEDFSPFPLSQDRMGPAIIIVPVPLNCNKYYIIYLYALVYNDCPNCLLFYKQELRYSEFDITLNGNTGGITPGKKHLFVDELKLDDIGSIAVSKLLSNNTRNVYFVGSEAYTSGSVIKSTLDANGITSPVVIHSTTTANDFSTSQVVISRNQEMLAFANLKKPIGTPVNDVTLIHLDPLTGNINTNLGVNGITGYNLPGIVDQAYSGIAFSPDNTKLLVGAVGVGVYWIDIATGTVSPTIITGTNTFGTSQLAVSYLNDWVYAATAANNLQAIDASGAIPVLAGGPGSNVTFAGNAVIANAQTQWTFNNPPIFTLPAQVDGEEINMLDLYTKDVPDDNGVEPDPHGTIMWISDDIWVRNQQDGFTNQFHENPIYTGNPVYVYVRIRNLSCIDFVSTPTDLLHAYFAKAATALAWPAPWDGSTPPCAGNINAPMGGELTPPQQIPNIPANSDDILEFTWNNMPDPSLYNACANPEPWHFCLLSRIDSPNDPMTYPEIPSVYDNVKNNNNIAWKNITVIDPLLDPIPSTECYSDRQVGGVIAVGNPFRDNEDNYKLEFKVDDQHAGKPITEQAEIKITLDDRSWDKWRAGGYQGENIRIRREDCHQLVVTGSPAALKNLRYQPMERSTMTLSFNFLTDEIDATPEFDYHVIQTRSEDDKIIGGELYKIRKPVRGLFGADGGSNESIREGESVTLSANTIGESAYFNWYDPDGNLIYSGPDFTASPEITTTYQLEVVALSDGFTSYDDVTVQVSEFQIESLSPNPVTDMVTVQYNAANASSAYLVISHAGGASNNYILTTSANATTIDVSNYTPGNYNVILICNGEVQDQKQLTIL